MRRCAAIAAVVLCAASLPARPQARSGAAGPESEVELTADRIVYDWEDRKLVLEGHVVATRGPALLRAPRGSLDRRTGILRLEGGVLAVQGRQVLVAEAAVVDLESRSVDLKDATVFLKDRTAPPPQLLTDRAAVRAAGKNALVLTGKRIRRLPSGTLVAEDVTMTPCDCAGDPDFELASPEVEVTDDRARLSSPRLRLLGASLPLLVPVSLPITERQSGLLFPPFQYTAITGFGTEVPLFLTLGRSYDLTVAPGYFSGSGGDTGPVPGTRAVVGPRLGLQFRYAPVERTGGQLDLDLVRDAKARDSPGGATAGEVPSSPGRGYDSVRGVLRFRHRTEAPGLVAAAEGSLATDNMFLQDTEIRELDRFLDALRTDAGIARTQGPVAAGVDTTLLFDVRTSNPASPDRRLFGPERRATFQRLPSAFGQLAPTRIGPFAFTAELSATRFAPFTALDPRERDTGFGPTDLGAANVTEPVPDVTDPLGLGRARAVRFDTSPRLSWGASGLPVLISGEVGARADAWLFDGAAGRNRQRAYGLASARAELSLERPWGSMLHTLTPGVELRLITPALRSGGPPIGDPFDAGGPRFASAADAAQQGVAPGLSPRADVTSPVLGVPAARRPYDELDGAAPEEGEALATVHVNQVLWTRSSPGRAPGALIGLDLRQDFVLRAGGAGRRIGESGGSLGFGWGPVRVGAAAQYDWGLRALTLVGGNLSVRNARGDEAHAGFSLQRGAASERIRGGIDELFAAARVASDPGNLFGSASFGGSATLPLRRQGLRVAYDASHLLPAGTLPPDTADWSHRFALIYDTPCRCAGLQLYANFPFSGGKLLKSPYIGFLLDLKALGSFGLSST
jgi:LPS-assembly protein